MSVFRLSLVAASAVFLVGCGTAAQLPAPRIAVATGAASVVPEVRLVFRAGRAFAREAGREWPIAEVGRDEMLWAPDGQRFAYLRRGASARLSGLGALAPATWSVVIRNLRGDSVNEFPVYRPGKPSELDWIDNSQLAYLAPVDTSGDAYVIHSAASGEVLQVLRGERFAWSPGRKQLAFIAGKRGAATVRVGVDTVWPREAASPRARRSIVGSLAWSPDGASLSFMERVGNKGNLVVLLVLDNRQGDLTWPLPAGALDAGHHIFWAESRVTIGKSQFEPRFAASWKRLR